MKKILAFLLIAVIALSLLTPINAWFYPGNPPSDDLMHNQFGPMSDHLKCSVWGSQLAEYEAFLSLVEPQVDFMDWALAPEQVAELTDLDPNMATYARMFFTDRGMREFDLNNMRFPTNDVYFRIALAHCFNKPLFVASLGGLAIQMDSPLAWSDPGWYNHYCDNLYPYDLQAAVDVLIAHGYYDQDADGWVEGPLGQEIELVMYCRSDDAHRSVMGSILANTLMTELDDQDWGDEDPANINVNEIQAVKSVCFQKVMVEFDYHIYTGGWSFGRDPTILYELYRSDEAQAYPYTGNYPGYQNAIFDANGILFLNAPDPVTAKPYIFEMQKQLANEVGIIPVFTYASYGAYKSHLQKVVNTAGVGPWGWFTFMDAFRPSYDTINWGFMNDIETLNVMHSGWISDWQILDKIYDTLIKVDPYDMSIDKPWMAKTWEMSNWTYEEEDATKITFKLREDMYWQDVPALEGRHRPDMTTFLEAGAFNMPVTAEDVKFSIDYLKANDTNWNWDLVEQVVNCEVSDPYTVSVYFDSYMPLWALHKVGGVPIIPKHIWENIPNVGVNAQSRSFDPIGQRCLAGCGPWVFNYDTSVPHTYYMLDAYHRYFRYHPVDLYANIDHSKIVEPCDTVNIEWFLRNQDFQRVIPPSEMNVEITIYYPNGTSRILYSTSNPALPPCEEVPIFSFPLHIDDWGLWRVIGTISPDPLTGHTDQDGYIVYLWSTMHACMPSTRYPWPMFHQNLRHTGYSESPAPTTNKTQWTYTTGNIVISSPAIAYDKVYSGSGDGKVYCLDASTGAHIWNYTTWGGVDSSPAVADGKVYVGSHDYKVYCLDAETGAQIWNYTTGNEVASSPAVANGRVYFGSYDRFFYCLNASTGAQIWNYTLGDWVVSSPAVVNGRVYFGSRDYCVYCLDAETGAHIWDSCVGNWIDSSPAVVDGKVYVGSWNTGVYCLDASTGIQIWSYTTGEAVYSSPAVAYGKVYVGSDDNKTYCLNASTGAQIWSYTTGEAVYSSPAVADGKVYVGSFDGKVYCLDASTGTLIWNYATGGWVWSSPAVADGVVYVGSYDKKIYAFGNVIRVPEDYPTIQEAINNATQGDIISIALGIYNGSVVVNKPLTILGRKGSDPIFVGGGSGIAFNILANASGTTIAGIVITNYAQAIFIDGASNCKIYDNIMTQNVNSGIAEGNSAANNLIYSNIFQQNPGVAINLTQYSTGNTIYSNTFILNSIGLNIESGGNTIYWNIFIDNTRQADIEDPLHNTNAWDNGYPDGGNYWSTHISVDLYRGPNQNEVGSDGINDTQCTIAVNNIDYYPLVKPFSPHDIGITNVILSKTVIGQGFTLSIDLKILNYGIYDELFTVTIYADTSIIATQITTLTKRNSTTITFTWNVTGFAKGNYTISAYAWPVLGEIETIDNTLKDGWIIITMIGDIVPDGTVDIFDIVTVAVAYGSTPSDPNWNPNADLVEDNIIDIFDLVTIAIHFGETDP